MNALTHRRIRRALRLFLFALAALTATVWASWQAQQPVTLLQYAQRGALVRCAPPTPLPPYALPDDVWLCPSGGK